MSSRELPPPEVAEALANQDLQRLDQLAATGDKAARKAAKRALHLLKARGIERSASAEATAAPSTVPGTPQTISASVLPARVTTFDSQGNRAAFVPVKADLGFALYVVIVTDTAKLEALDQLALSGRQLKSYWSSLPAETRAVLREVAPGRARALLAPGLEGANEPHGVRARELLSRLPTALPAEPTTSVAADATAGLAESAALFETAPFAGYAAEPDVLRTLSHKLEEVAASPLFVDQTQRHGQLRHTIERAVVDYFSRAMRERYALRLADAAELFESLGDGSSTARAAATAAAFRGEGDVLGIPFARALFERLFALKEPAAPEAARPAPAGSLPAGNLIVAP